MNIIYEVCIAKTTTLSILSNGNLFISHCVTDPILKRSTEPG
jgi:hypothetical protein